MVVDAFSKFVSFHPVHKITGRVVLDGLERSFFPAYGIPTFLVTDNARVFCCRLYRDLFSMGVKHLITTPYYPQGSLAERVNRNLKSVLKMFHHSSQKT